MGRTSVSVQGRLVGVVCIVVMLVTRADAEGPSSPSAGETGLDRLPPANAKALESWSYALAINAATWGSPAVIMHCLRYNDALGPRPKAAPNALWRMANISTPELAEQAGYVTPNVNTVYGFGFLDLGPQPVDHDPPRLAGALLHGRGRRHVDQRLRLPGRGRSAATAAAPFAMVGPGWKGNLPPGLRRIDAPTRWVLIQPRVHLKDQADLPGARAVLEGDHGPGTGRVPGPDGRRRRRAIPTCRPR